MPTLPSTPIPAPDRTPPMSAGGRRNFWAVPVLSVLVGLLLLAGAWLGGSPGLGWGMFAIMLTFAVAVVLAARRSETIRGLMDRNDERISSIDLAATALAGMAVITAIIVAFVVDLARGGDGMPYAWLGAVAGLSYLVAVVWLRIRG